MAGQLPQAGEKTDLLMLVDTQIDRRYLPMPQRWANLVRRHKGRTELFRSLDGPAKWRYLVAKSLVFVARCWLAVGLGPFLDNPVADAKYPPAQRRIRNAALLATRAYKPRLYAGKVVLVRAEKPGPNEPLLAKKPRSRVSSSGELPRRRIKHDQGRERSGAGSRDVASPVGGRVGAQATSERPIAVIGIAPGCKNPDSVSANDFPVLTTWSPSTRSPGMAAQRKPIRRT